MYSREIDGQKAEFGTSGYTMNNVFVLYDRLTDSVWYPLGDGTMDAVSGQRKGTSIPILAEPAPMRLGRWLKDHPDSKVLLPRPHSKTVRDLRTEEAPAP